FPIYACPLTSHSCEAYLFIRHSHDAARTVCAAGSTAALHADPGAAAAGGFPSADLSSVYGTVRALVSAGELAAGQRSRQHVPRAGYRRDSTAHLLLDAGAGLAGGAVRHSVTGSHRHSLVGLVRAQHAGW